MRFCLPLIGLFMLCMSVSAMEMEKAGTTIANAPYIEDTMMLEVQSGANYIRIEPKRLPATVTYLPSAPFGTIPEMIIMGDTLPKQAFFGECEMGWIWTIPENEATALVGISSHEKAMIVAAPRSCSSTFGDTTAVACDAFTWYGESLTTSGDYAHVLTNAAGCDSIVTLHLTIRHATSGELTIEKCERYISPSGKEYTNSGTFTETISNVSGCDSVITINLTILHDCMGPTEYDTVFFCRGFNTEHEESMGDGMVRRYRQYVFQSPAEWDFMEGVIVAGEPDRTLLDLRRAEKNLYAHYVDGLTPVSAIRWSVQYDGKGKYEPLTVTDTPQWVETGHVAVQVNFLCGEMYNTEFPTDIEHISQDAVSMKRVENGRVVIIRGGVKYDILGTKIQ